MDTTRRSLILMGKYGLSRGVACCTLAGTEVRYFMFGENNLITSAHTRSFSKKLNSGCCKRNMINNITPLVIPGNKRTRNVVEHLKDSVSVIRHYHELHGDRRPTTKTTFDLIKIWTHNNYISSNKYISYFQTKGTITYFYHAHVKVFRESSQTHV